MCSKDRCGGTPGDNESRCPGKEFQSRQYCGRGAVIHRSHADYCSPHTLAASLDNPSRHNDRARPQRTPLAIHTNALAAEGAYSPIPQLSDTRWNDLR